VVPYVPPVDAGTGGGEGRISAAVHVPQFRPALRDPHYAANFQPPYPLAQQREGTEGRCPVSVSIGANGRVLAVRDAGCSDPAFFRATERQALHSWHFEPATRDGVAVPSEQTLTVQFRIAQE